MSGQSGIFDHYANAANNLGRAVSKRKVRGEPKVAIDPDSRLPVTVRITVQETYLRIQGREPSSIRLWIKNICRAAFEATACLSQMNSLS
jgi:hypothetical protein